MAEEMVQYVRVLAAQPEPEVSPWFPREHTSTGCLQTFTHTLWCARVSHTCKTKQQQQNACEKTEKESFKKCIVPSMKE